MPDHESSNVLDQLREIGALKVGHFLLASGRHSDRYLEKFDLLRRPAATEHVCQGFTRVFADQAIDVVVGPTTGGVILAFETARQLGVSAAYSERRGDGQPGREIRRGTTFPPGSRVMVVDDILTTGGSVRETLDSLKAHPVEVVAIAVLVDRSGGKVTFEVPIHPLAQEDVPSWLPDECPLCAQSIPLIKPGTTNVGA